MQKRKAKHKDLAFAPQMQDWISQERWSERIIAILCLMVAIPNIWLIYEAVGWIYMAIRVGLVGIAIIGIYLWWRTSKPQKIQERLRNRLHHSTSRWFTVGGIVLLIAVVWHLATTYSGVPLNPAASFFVRSLTALVSAFGIQAIWRGWKLGQMQTFYAG